MPSRLSQIRNFLKKKPTPNPYNIPNLLDINNATLEGGILNIPLTKIPKGREVEDLTLHLAHSVDHLAHPANLMTRFHDDHAPYEYRISRKTTSKERKTTTADVKPLFSVELKNKGYPLGRRDALSHIKTPDHLEIAIILRDSTLSHLLKDYFTTLCAQATS